MRDGTKKAGPRKEAGAGIGLTPAETQVSLKDVAGDLARLVERAGGVVLGTYRGAVRRQARMLVSLPIDRVEPTPFQRGASEPHVNRLMTVIETLDAFLDPINRRAARHARVLRLV